MSAIRGGAHTETEVTPLSSADVDLVLRLDLPEVDSEGSARWFDPDRWYDSLELSDDAAANELEALDAALASPGLTPEAADILDGWLRELEAGMELQASIRDELEELDRRLSEIPPMPMRRLPDLGEADE